MMKKIFIISFILMISGNIFTSDLNQWENLKKIIFYNSSGNHEFAIKTLEELSLENISRSEKKIFISKLENLGNYYADKKMYDKAELFYKKIEISSDSYWKVHNNLEKLGRKKGSLFYDLKNFIIQVLYLMKNFESSFLIINLLINVIYYSGIFVFFIISIILIIKYFKLLSNDLFFNENKSIAVKNISIFLILLFWPILIFSGWLVFPFLISGLLWIYIGKTERNTIIFMILLIMIFTIVFSFNKIMEKNISNENFDIIKNVYTGHSYKNDDYSRFDNELKVFQAFTYYEKENYDTSLDILLSTGDRYENTFKYNLMGAIYLQSGNLEKSTKILKKALDLDEKNKTALYNFTVALARQKNTNVFNSYAKRFPKIIEYKGKIGNLKKIELDEQLLWKRILSSSKENIGITYLLFSILKGIFLLPAIYYSMIFFIYVFFLKKIFSNLGESTNCSKCNKIIKEKSIDITHKFCEECYQLFMIKDMIFQEAKISKETQLKQRRGRKFTTALLFSLIFPGINLNFKGKNFSFVILSILYYSILLFSVSGIFLFNKIYSMYPILFNITLILSFIFYFLLNIYSLRGEEDGI